MVALWGGGSESGLGGGRNVHKKHAGDMFFPASGKVTSACPGGTKYSAEESAFTVGHKGGEQPGPRGDKSGQRKTVTDKHDKGSSKGGEGGEKTAKLGRGGGKQNDEEKGWARAGKLSQTRLKAPSVVTKEICGGREDGPPVPEPVHGKTKGGNYFQSGQKRGGERPNPKHKKGNIRRNGATTN